MEFVFSKDLNFDTELMMRKYLLMYNFKPEDRTAGRQAKSAGYISTSK